MVSSWSERTQFTEHYHTVLPICCWRLSHPHQGLIPGDATMTHKHRHTKECIGFNKNNNNYNICLKIVLVFSLSFQTCWLSPAMLQYVSYVFYTNCWCLCWKVKCVSFRIFRRKIYEILMKTDEKVWIKYRCRLMINGKLLWSVLVKGWAATKASRTASMSLEEIQVLKLY